MTTTTAQPIVERYSGAELERGPREWQLPNLKPGRR